MVTLKYMIPLDKEIELQDIGLFNHNNVVRYLQGMADVGAAEITIGGHKEGESYVAVKIVFAKKTKASAIENVKNRLSDEYDAEPLASKNSEFLFSEHPDSTKN
ncbi:hypothetical protein KAT92_05800 [Candidatus Babeliales bacterium]|nr:hypothetical protein [Candidatus Babeliales bacterium]